jgi:sensor domain CHASE-containing protein
MNLKAKLLIIICGVLAVLCLICLVIQKAIVFSGFVEQENIQAENDMDRIRQTFRYPVEKRRSTIWPPIRLAW